MTDTARPAEQVAALARLELPFLLAMAFRAMTDRLHTQLAAEGREPLRPAHGYTFRFVADHAEPSVVALAEHLEVSKQAASQLVAELEDWGYLTRRKNPRDGRAVTLSLTRKGRAYIAHVDGIWASVEEEWAALVGVQRLAAVRRDLAAFIANSATDDPPRLRPVW